MQRFLRSVTSFRRDRSGATAIEYALIATVVGGGVAGIVVTLGDTVFTQYYETVAAAISEQVAPSDSD